MMSVQNEAIHTYARIKPLFMGEEKMFFKKNICTVISKNQDQFGFDGVFDAESTNEQVYNQSTKKIIQHSFQGFNSCVMAYGQTSSGKTYTMKGTQSNPGIIPLCLRDIFHKIIDQKIQAKIVISYMEIYNEDIIDLLSDRQNSIVEPREDQKRNLTLFGLQEFVVLNMGQAMDLFRKGEDKRKFASNNLNVNSSRSHAIFRINLKIVDDDLNETISQINLVDLAGSEGIERTKAEKISKFQGENINKSILALTKVIKTMSERDQHFINFRDSKLTRILQKSLCENSKSTVICMINPSIINHQECTNTLKFGQMAAKIRIQARQNMIRTQQQKKKQQNYGNMQFLPSEKIQLQQSRKKLRFYEQQMFCLRKRNKQLQQQNYMKQESMLILEKQYKDLSDEYQHYRRSDQDYKKSWWREKQMLDNRVECYKEEIQRLERLMGELKEEKRILEKNERSLVENLQHYENQCRQMNSQINSIRAKMNEENSKTMKTSVMSSIKSERGVFNKPKPNPFQLPPYKESPDRLSPTKLSWIVQLKIQVIDLGRQVNQFTKANIQIAQQNEQLRKKIEEYQQKSSKQRSSGKINPQALQYNQIKKLNNKIKNLKSQLKRSQDRQRKNREILKKQSHKNLIQMEEFQQWYTKKYTNNYFVDKEIQYDIGSQQFSNQNILLNKSNDHFASNSKSEKGLILNKNNPLIKSQNPEDYFVKHSDKEDYLLSDESKPLYDENRDININGINFENQNLQISPDNRQSFLLDNLGPNQFTPNYSNNSKNFISFDESVRSKKNSKNMSKQKNQIGGSKKFKLDQGFFGFNTGFSKNMIPQEEKDLQI